MISETTKIIQFENNNEFMLHIALYSDVSFNVKYDIV
jgi:hypothetical protein